MPTLAMFLPLAKVDADQRIVQGVATAEQPDRSGEICDYDSTKPYFEAWSALCHEASGGKSLGAVRAMHGNVAAGKLTDISFDDESKRILVAAKIVDDDEWNKVLEGVYTGFSQGGRYIARWEDEATGLWRYTADPIEISLVDLPCLPEATFEVVRNGVSEFRKFAEAPQSGEPVSSPVEQEAAQSGDKTVRLSVDDVQMIKADVPAPISPVAPDDPPESAKALPSVLQKEKELLGKAATALSEAANKLERVVAESSGLHKTMSHLELAFASLEKRLATIEAQPAPARAFLRAPPKESDGLPEAPGGSVEAAIKRIAALPDDQRAMALTKVSLANPVARLF